MKMSIPWAKPSSFPQEQEYVSAALKSNWLSDGEWLRRFELEFAKYIEAPCSLSVSNGTTALQLALLGADVGPGDEVIVPNFSFVAPGNMVVACGATPVFADINNDDWNLSAESLESHISSKTKAVIYVHNFGLTGDVSRIQEICKSKNILLIEDVAEACFSKFKEQFAGTFGDIGCFSFQATKTITTGEGGMVVCRDKKLLEKMKRIRSHGMEPSKRYWHVDIGYNFRLTNLQAALGCAQLENLPWILEERKKINALYTSLLSSQKNIQLQKCHSDCEPVVWTFPVLLKGATEEIRDGIIKNLAEVGIETRPGFYPYTRLPLYKKYWGSKNLTVSEAASKQIILMSFFPGLKNQEVEYICDQLIKNLNY